MADPVPASLRDDITYRLLAGAARSRLLESWLDLRLAPLLFERGPLNAGQIAEILGLHPKRAAKWLALLARVGLIDWLGGTTYGNSSVGEALFWHEGQENFFLRDITDYCRHAAQLNTVAVLRGLPMPETVRWPPPTPEAAAHLELWMTISAEDAVKALEVPGDLDGVGRLLDVGGGDATVACALVKAHPGLHVTVFNLPNSAKLARERIARQKLEERVSVVEGDFQRDSLPSGFDRVQYSRVLADWDSHTCRLLLGRAYMALDPGGTIVICEPFVDENPDLTVSWEFRYLFYDDFGVATYKTTAQYRDMLASAGFVDVTVRDRVADTIYGVMTAKKKA
jgi:hypothetical protein